MMLLVFLAPAIGILVAAVAVPCAQLGAFATYLKVLSIAVVVAILCFVAVALSIPPHHLELKVVLFYSLVFIPLGLLYSLTPGLLVKRRAPTRTILISTAVTSAIGVPVWYFYSLILACRDGGC